MTDCPNCLLLAALADDGRARVCDPCRKAAAPRVAARPLAPLPPPDATERVRLAAPDVHDAARDLSALARHPRLRAQSLEPIRAAELDEDDLRALAALADETPEARERRQERDVYRARAARERLAAMAARGPEGRRYAALAWAWYGGLGDAVRAQLLTAEGFGRVHGADGERAAFKAAFEREHAKLTEKQREAFWPAAYGNRLVGVATAAYERDEWAPVVEAAPVRPATRAEKLRAALAEAREATRRWLQGEAK